MPKLLTEQLENLKLSVIGFTTFTYSDRTRKCGDGRVTKLTEIPLQTYVQGHVFTSKAVSAGLRSDCGDKRDTNFFRLRRARPLGVGKLSPAASLEKDSLILRL